jgi:hypothetical protein
MFGPLILCLQLTAGDPALETGQPVLDAAVAPAVQVTTIPAMTPVDIEILDHLNSKTSQIGERFRIRLVEPIRIGDSEVAPKGLLGEGEVIHAAKARMAGKAGELILAARYLDFNGRKLPLRSFKYGPSQGKDNIGNANAAALIVSSALLIVISGGQVDIKPGLRANAKISEDVNISATTQQN